MFAHLWKCWSVFHSALSYLIYGSLGFIYRLVPPFIKNSLSTPEEPDDLERCGRDTPSITNNNILKSNEEEQYASVGEVASLVPYEPLSNEPLSQGSTSLITRIKPGVVVKCPRFSWWHSETADSNPFVKDIKRNFEVEEQLLDILGAHPRIIRYVGISEEPHGLMFGEATDGNLQAYIDQHHDTIDLCLRLKWCCQAAEAVHYIHQKGVIHSDLRPENFLLHSDSKGNLDLLLCDFGGSTCGDIDGGHLPDSGFFNPCRPWVSTEAVDIFSLGSIFYTIMTGHWPYKSPGPFKSVAEKIDYDELVDTHFSSQDYPPVDSLPGGAVIQGCWTERYDNVGALIGDQILSYSEIGAFRYAHSLEVCNE
ncbi:unnamed protein product [Penicillium salamii]|nr:unnamed protein product [Penicillium salamii]CAG8224444.1 unnamed protein product [Penicillium salamii]CAG8396576.1 unnamed protein product [Penicillium salamii]